MTIVFIGHDWAEDHHDIYLEDAHGRRLHRGRVGHGLVGAAEFHAIVAAHADEPTDVLIASETDRGLFASAVVAAGYAVIAINPMSR